MDLDSRGNPLKKTSNTLQHLIDEISGHVDFVDQEQEIERATKRPDLNLDLED